MSTLPDEDDVAAAVSGQLRERPFPNLLLQLYHARFDGHLELIRDPARKRISFHHGAPIATESNLASESLGVQLMDARAISRDDYVRVVDHVKRRGCKEGAALLELKLLEPRMLFDALKQQLRTRVLDCFAWPDAEYSLHPEEPGDDAVQPFRTDPFLLVRDGLAAHWAVDRLLEQLSPHLGCYAEPGKGCAQIIHRLSGNEAADAVLHLLSRHRSLGDCLGTAGSTPAAVASLWVVWSAGALKLHDAPPAAQRPSHGDGDTLSSEIEIAVGSAEAAAQPAEGEPDKTIRKAASPSPKGDADSAMRSEVLDKHERLDELDCYSLLGVESDASGATIKKAYFHAAKRYHPDAVARLGLEELKREANEVFSRIAEAYEVLSNESKRREYDASLEHGDEQADANALAKAETFYRKGEILVRMGDFRGALEFLEPAVELWPDEGAYQSALGWSHYKMSPSDPEKARVHLDRAVTLDPQNAVAQFRLGVLLRSLGETDAAEKALARAKQLDPKVS